MDEIAFGKDSVIIFCSQCEWVFTLKTVLIIQVKAS